MKAYRYLPVITGWFVATLVITNILNAKVFVLFGLSFPVGILTFPLAFLFGDLLTEVYGYAVTRRTIWVGFSVLAAMAVLIELGRVLPPAAFWQNQTAYESVLGQIPRIVIASIVAYWSGEFCNSYVLAKMKVMSSGKGLPARLVASTAVGQAVDTLAFMSIAFIGVFPTSQLIQLFVSSWLVKVVWETVALPATIPIVTWLKNVEREDFYDRSTDFNPFSFSVSATENKASHVATEP